MPKEISVAPVELGTERIGKLLQQYAMPAIIAMIASSLYNMVDSIYIGQGIGALAISGLAVAFPLMNLSTAFGTLVGMGCSTILSILLGQKNYGAANKVLSNIMALNIIISLIFAVTALIFMDPILYFFGASENTIGYAREYMQILMYGNIFSHCYFGLNNAFRTCGKPKIAMGLTVFTVLFNSALDPILIFGFKMGIQGAAIATIAAQMVALAYSVYYFADHRRPIHFEKGIVRLDFRIAKDSLAIGAGPFLMNAAACMVSLFVNQQFRKYSGDLGIGAFGICNRITFIFIMMCMGFNQGMQPIAGYNYGARQYSRVKEVYKKTVFFAIICTSACFLACELLPKYAVLIFTHDQELYAMAHRGLRLMNIIVPIVGFQIVSTNLFQCLGMVSRSVILSLSRQVICLIPLLYLLPLWLGSDGIWLSYPASDIISSVMTLIMILGLFRKLDKIKDGDDPDILGSNYK